jgi:hypothetical protein
MPTRFPIRFPIGFPIRSHLLTPIAAALLPLGASALTTVTAHAPPTVMCGSEFMPTDLEPRFQLVCALDKGILQGSANDQTRVIQEALTELADVEKGLFFPAGRYVVGHNLDLRTGNSLVGSRRGTTQFVNPNEKTAKMLRTFHSAKRILIEGLVLDNFQINPAGNDTGDDGWVVRYNGLRGSSSPDAQILISSGTQTIEGNVLWRLREQPGSGIQAIGGVTSIIARNLIGAVDPNTAARFINIRTRRLAAAMGTLPMPTGGLPPAPAERGFYVTALSATAGAPQLQVERNDVALSPSAAGAGQSPSRHAALFARPASLTLYKNRFTGAEPSDVAPVTLLSPTDTNIAGNLMIGVDLRIEPATDEPPPATPPATKRTVVRRNEFNEAVVATTQRATGWSDTDTTPDDLLFIDNRFTRAQIGPCLLSAPVPTLAGMTFSEADNLMSSGGFARACNLNHASPQGALMDLPLAPDRPRPDPTAPDDVELSLDSIDSRVEPPASNPAIETHAVDTTLSPPVTRTTPDRPAVDNNATPVPPQVLKPTPGPTPEVKKQPWHRRLATRLATRVTEGTISVMNWFKRL